MPDPLQPTEVLSFAEAAIRHTLPDFEVERLGDASLTVKKGTREIRWNLHDVIRRASPTWREDVLGAVAQTAEKLREAADERAAERTFSLDDVVVLVWPEEKLRRLPADMVVTEPLAPGLHLFYGCRGGGRIQNVKPEDLVEHELSLATLRTHAVANLGLTLESLGVGPMFKDAPVLTNHEGSMVATSLFADQKIIARLLATFRGSFLLAMPAPSRFFITPNDPRLVPILEQVVAQSTEVEETFLTSHVFRVTAGGWELASGQ
ncbi:MAG TPA: hypothetical protein VGH28_33730 [Polyangiaceae bacterium]|jgi:hypothetical protein